ncbi:MAG: DUF502 domain-containing protein [Candidatus Neomarinimicrobiota bacterium]
MWIKLRKIILTGLFAVLPIAATVWILRIIFLFLEGMTAPILKRLGIEIPGVGLLLTLVIIFLLGLFVTNVLGKRLFSWGEKILHKIPMVSTIYSTIKQITNAFSGATVRSFKKVIFIQYPRKGLWTMSFVTNESTNAFGDEYYHVFVPTTPNPTSGVFTIILREEAILADITVEEGLKAIISGGILDPGEKPISSFIPKK